MLLTFASCCHKTILMQASNHMKIFDYNDPTEYLLSVYNEKKKRNPSFSLRAWTKQIGLRHHAMLSMIFSGKRRLKPGIATKIKNSLDLNPIESRYFDMLVMFKNSDNQEEKGFYADILSGLRPEKTFSDLKLDVFRYISDWYHTAIIEMTNLSDFKFHLRGK